LPADLSALTDLNLSQNLLTTFTLPTGMSNLIELDLDFNQLTNLTLPNDLRNLSGLDLDFNQLTLLHLPSSLTRLGALHLRANQFTSFNLPVELTNLSYLDVSENPVSSVNLPSSLSHLTNLRLSQNTNLTSLTLPTGLTGLTGLNLAGNRLTNILLPPDLGRLESLNLNGNQLTSLDLPPGLTNLVGLFVVANRLTSLTLPPDLTEVIGFGYLGNPLTTLVLSEPTAANLAGDVDFLRNQGVSVFVYPLSILSAPPCVTRDSLFWFSHIVSPPRIILPLGDFCATLENVFDSLPNASMDLGFLQVNLNQALGLFWGDASSTGEGQRSGVCSARKRLAIELVAATANLLLNIGGSKCAILEPNSGEVIPVAALIQESRAATQPTPGVFDCFNEAAWVNHMNRLAELLALFNNEGTSLPLLPNQVSCGVGAANNNYIHSNEIDPTTDANCACSPTP
jgi:hypothetical protein